MEIYHRETVPGSNEVGDIRTTVGKQQVGARTRDAAPHCSGVGNGKHFHGISVCITTFKLFRILPHEP